MSRTSAEHISIHALSAEPLEPAICCSSLAMRSICASTCAGAAVCAKRTTGEHKQIKANQRRRNLDIVCSAPCSGPSSDQRPRTDRLDEQSNDCRATREIENIYGRYKQFCLACAERIMGGRCVLDLPDKK